MLKAFFFVSAFALVCVIGMLSWISFTDVPIEQHMIEQPIALPSDLPPAALAPETP